MTMPTPYVASYDKTRMALVTAIDEHQATVLQCTESCWDLTRVPLATFRHDYAATDEYQHVGKKVPTVVRFLEMLGTTTIPKSDAVVSFLEELAMSKTVAINTKGEVEANASAKSIVLDQTTDLDSLRETVAAKLSERALANFVSQALGLAKPLARVREDDKRITQAIQKLLDASNAQAPVEAAAKKAAKKTVAAASKTTTAKKAAAKTHKPGAKRALYDMLKAGKKHTLEQFAKLTGSSESNIRTALTDLKNPKYAIDDTPLNITRSESGVYSLTK